MKGVSVGKFFKDFVIANYDLKVLCSVSTAILPLRHLRLGHPVGGDQVHSKPWEVVTLLSCIDIKLDGIANLSCCYSLSHPTPQAMAQFSAVWM